MHRRNFVGPLERSKYTPYLSLRTAENFWEANSPYLPQLSASLFIRRFYQITKFAKRFLADLRIF